MTPRRLLEIKRQVKWLTIRKTRSNQVRTDLKTFNARMLRGQSINISDFSINGLANTYYRWKIKNEGEVGKNYTNYKWTVRIMRSSIRRNRSQMS